MRPALWLFLLSAGAALAEQQPGGGLVAVLEFQNKLGSDAGQVDATYFTDLARATVRDAAPGLRVTTRDILEQAIVTPYQYNEYNVVTARSVARCCARPLDRRRGR